MGLFGIFGGNKQVAGLKFKLPDGKLITPEEYGVLSVAVAINSASNSFDFLFNQNEHANKMFLAKLAIKDRFITEVVMSALVVGVYLHHMLWTLRVIDDNIFSKVAKGIDDGYKNVTSNDGNTLSPQLRKILFTQASSYVNTIKEDLRPNTVMNDTPSATILLKNIANALSNWLNNEDKIKLNEEMEKSTTTMLLKAYVNDDIMAATLAIEGANRVDFVFD